MNDNFGIIVDNWNAPTRFYVVSSRMLAMQEWQRCGDLDSPRGSVELRA